MAPVGQEVIPAGFGGLAEGGRARGDYVPMRTVYVRLKEEGVSGLCLALELFEGIEPGSPEEAIVVLTQLERAWAGKLAEIDGFLFVPTASVTEFKNSVPIGDGTVVEWTVADPAVEPMLLLVRRTIGYEVTTTYLARMTRAEYEGFVEANGGDEFDALEDLVLSSHRGSPDPDPRVTFIDEEWVQTEDGYDYEAEVVSEEEAPWPVSPPPPYLDEATDDEIAAELTRRVRPRAAQ